MREKYITWRISLIAIVHRGGVAPSLYIYDFMPIH